MTNIVLIASTLLTNNQVAVTARTNKAAQLTHVERVYRINVEGLKHGRKIVPYQTNQVQVSQRKWNEVIPDFSQPTPAPTPAARTSSQPAATNKTVSSVKRQEILDKRKPAK